MRLYTRTGDAGATGLYDGGRASKSSPRIHALGEVDETNAAIGLARALAPEPMLDALLARVQHRLFDLGADLSNPVGPPRLQARHVEELEQAIDRLEADNAPLRGFILPGGAPPAAALHLARTVARRAERALAALADAGEAVGPDARAWLNRLSDFLFAAARSANRAHGDLPWDKDA